MNECCTHCYIKYIQKDGTLDSSFIEKNFGQNFSILEKPRKIDPIMLQLILKNKQEVPVDTFILVNGNEHLLCTCSCHIHGIHVFH